MVTLIIYLKMNISTQIYGISWILKITDFIYQQNNSNINKDNLHFGMNYSIKILRVTSDNDIFFLKLF